MWSSSVNYPTWRPTIRSTQSRQDPTKKHVTQSGRSGGLAELDIPAFALVKGGQDDDAAAVVASIER